MRHGPVHVDLYKLLPTSGIADADPTVEPVPPGGGLNEPDVDKLSNIIKTFNDLFRNVDWKDGDKIHHVIAEEIPSHVARDKAYKNAQANYDQRTPSRSMMRRSSASCWTCCMIAPSSSNSSATTPASNAG